MLDPDIRRTTEEYLATLDARGEFGRFLTTAVTIEIPGNADVPRVTGRDAVEEFVRNFHEVAFEATVAVRRVLVGDGGSSAELVFDGLHRGEFAGVPATQKRVSLPYCAAYDFQDDAISAIRVYLSVPDLVAQLRP